MLNNYSMFEKTSMSKCKRVIVQEQGKKMDQELNTAIELLKDIVKESHIKGQMHLDLTLSPASKHEEYKNALIIVQQKIKNGDLTENMFKELLGLI